jgi:Ricin-type beta-trefoil lectin domain
MARPILFVSALVLACAAQGSIDQTAATGSKWSTTTVSQGTYTMVRAGSGKCLDINGTTIAQWSCQGGSDQVFRVENVSGGIRLVNPATSKCVDVGTRIHLSACNGSAAQVFKSKDMGGGFFRLANPNSGKCLDINGASNDDGAIAQLWSCNSTTAQKWTFHPTDGGGGGGGDPGSNLVWHRANLTNFTSYPDPGSDECTNYNGCMWAGQFAFVDGKQSVQWVMSHNIIAVHERDAGTYALKTLRLKQGSHQIDATVYDECSDSDCSGCCTRNANAGGVGFLIDIESYTMDRFGSGDGVIEWACLDCN